MDKDNFFERFAKAVTIRRKDKIKINIRKFASFPRTIERSL